MELNLSKLNLDFSSITNDNGKDLKEKPIAAAQEQLPIKLQLSNLFRKQEFEFLYEDIPKYPISQKTLCRSYYIQITILYI